jgi:hypothetical protein
MGIGAHMFLSSFFPNEYHNALLNCSLYAILLFSRFEIYAKKIYYYPKIKSIIDSINKSNEIDIIKFNDLMFSTNKKYINVHNFLLYDFIIYSDYNSVTEKQTKVNKVLYFGFPKTPINFDYTLCKFSFISMTVNFNNKKYPLKLSTESENYYIVGNKINLLLVAYLLKTQYKVLCDEINGRYELDIIDHNVTMKTLTEKDEIILHENDYIVEPYAYVDTSNMTLLDIINNKPHFVMVNSIIHQNNQ